MADAPTGGFILGIDIGANSLGWALIDITGDHPSSIIRAGVRIFEAATEGDLESGREESRNRARRDSRLHRRQLWRRARRQKKVFNLLQHFGLLPKGASARPEDRQDLLNELDRSILASPWFAEKRASGLFPEPDQVLSYILRSTALDEALDPHAMGRALYHLSQRRGFLSNRKKTRTAKKETEEEGEVKKGIGELEEAIRDSGARTLGEFFARSSPTERRIRGRWTARAMYRDEFSQIWDAQEKSHPELLTEERKDILFRAIFHQRPIKFDPDVIGRCELEQGERRAPAYLLTTQRFRLLDKVNNLKVNDCPLTPADRGKLIQELELQGDLTFKQIRKLLGLTKDDLLNLQAGGEEKLPGNRTSSQFYEVFGQRWLDMPPEERERAVEYVNAFEKPDKLEEAARRKWGLDGDSAKKFAAISLEADYLSFSREAMQKLLPLMEEGVPLATARKQVYPESFNAVEPVDFLPPVADFGEIRNPAVIRSLTELRKVVNAIIREHGKPAEIRIELARELKKPKWQREAAYKKGRENEKARVSAAKRITAEAGIPNPSRTDIRKLLLADECGWRCPYTGQPITMPSLFGQAQFDIEHIIPFSRSLDDSFASVTLCSIAENRNRKGNQTPFEAYGGDAGRYEEILGRVRRFAGERGMVAEKLRRFQMNEEELGKQLGEFKDRSLNDTAYASTVALRYLGLLYGGVVDAEGKRRVHATSGQVTAYLRNEWRLNGILGDGATSNGGTGKVAKSRDDHRHHAVDAIAIALTDAGALKILSDAARRAPLEHRRRFASIPGPWPNFVDSVREQIGKIIVSHRASKKVSGALHEETNYGMPSGQNGSRRVRKLLASLSTSELQSVADRSVKKLVIEKVRELGGGEPKKLFADEKNLPCFEARDGRRIPIRRVRIEKSVPTFPVGKGRTLRHVASGSNHHLEIFAELDAEGKEVQWEGDVVPMVQAYRRNKEGLAVVQRDHGQQREFKFSLATGETIECDVQPSRRGLFVVRKMSLKSSGEIQVGFAPVLDARQAKVMQKSGAWLYSSPDRLRQRNARKVIVSPLGAVSEAND
jgi:CRISPR-associated endonuclease Csn1